MEDEMEGCTPNANLDTGWRCDAGVGFGDNRRQTGFVLIEKYPPLNEMKCNPLTMAGIGNKQSQ